MSLSFWIFAPVFLLQIFIISLYFPAKMIRRLEHVMDTYPPETYPKLYPRSKEYYRIFNWAFKWAYRLIFLFGLGLLGAAAYLDTGDVSPVWSAGYGMIQFIPLLMLDIVGFRLTKEMRRADTSKLRKAELRPRRLLSYVSPWLVLAAVLAFGLSAGMDFVLYEPSEWASRVGWLVFANVFMGVFGAWALYGRKPDPHQSFADRSKQIRVQLTSLMSVSIAISLFFLFMSLSNRFDMNYLEAPAMSCYFLLINFLSVGQMMRHLRLEDIDFEVYRDDSNGAPAVA